MNLSPRDQMFHVGRKRNTQLAIKEMMSSGYHPHLVAYLHYHYILDQTGEKGGNRKTVHQPNGIAFLQNMHYLEF